MKLEIQEPRCTVCGRPVGTCDCNDEDWEEDEDEEDWGAGGVDDNSDN